MKRTICIILMLVLALFALGGCGKKEPAAPSETPSAAQTEEKTVSGIINRLDEDLVLLVGEGEYQIMAYGEGVSADGLTEGDKVEITYTGELGKEDAIPVITAIHKAE